MESITFTQVAILLGIAGTVVAITTGITGMNQRKMKEVVTNVTTSTKSHADHESAIKLLEYQVSQLTKEVHSLRTDMHKYIDRIESQMEKILRRDD